MRADDPKIVEANNRALDRLLFVWQEIDRRRAGMDRPPPSADSERDRVLARAKAYVAREDPAISGQHGHDRTYHVACILVKGFDLTVQEGLQVIQDWNQTCREPWTEKELLHKLEDADKAPDDKPRGYLLTERNEQSTNNGQSNGQAGPSAHTAQTPPEPAPWEPIVPLADVPETPPFPLDVLPPALQTFVLEAAWAIHCPPDFVAVPLLAVASGAIGNARRLAITSSHIQSACLFAVVVGYPGSAKSPALELVGEPLVAAQRRYLAQWKALCQARRQQAEHEGTDQEPEPLRRCFADDTTTEKLLAVLAENPRGLLLFRDELAALATGMNQYRARGHGHDRQVYLKLWSHAAISVDRKSNAEGVPVTIWDPYLSIIGTIQPAVVESLRGEATPGKPPPDDGFLDRFLFSFPADLPAVEECWREVSQQAQAAWANTVEKLLGLHMVQTGNEYKPQTLPLGDTARLAWVQFTRQHAAEVNAEDFPDYLRGPWNKLRGYGARLALLLHCLRQVHEECDPRFVDGESVQRAATLVSYFKAHFRKVAASLDADPLVAAAKHVLRWIAREKRTEFKRRELYMDIKSQGRFPRVTDLDAPLGLLCRHNFLRIRPTTGKPGPGRPASPIYEVNPLVNNPQNPQNPQNDADRAAEEEFC